MALKPGSDLQPCRMQPTKICHSCFSCAFSFVLFHNFSLIILFKDLRLECLIKNSFDFNLNFHQLLDNLIEEDMIQEEVNSTLYSNHIKPTIIELLNDECLAKKAYAEVYIAYMIDGQTYRLLYNSLKVALGGTISETKHRFHNIATGHIMPLTIDMSHVTHEEVSEVKVRPTSHNISSTVFLAEHQLFLGKN